MTRHPDPDAEPDPREVEVEGECGPRRWRGVLRFDQGPLTEEQVEEIRARFPPDVPPVRRSRWKRLPFGKVW